MTNAGRCDPYKEEDEGFLAARNGGGLSENPYPRGTIRFKEWEHGWRIGRHSVGTEQAGGDRHDINGHDLADNPHPRGTIRHRQWSDEWHAKRRERERMMRLGGLSEGTAADQTGLKSIAS